MNRSRSFPDRPTNGSPCRSSCSPGPSPTNIRSAFGSPTPKTTLVRPCESGQRTQSCASIASSARSVMPEMLRATERVLDGQGDGFVGESRNDVDRGRRATHGGGHEGVTVDGGVDGPQRTGEPIVAGAGDELAADLVERGVGGDDA